MRTNPWAMNSNLVRALESDKFAKKNGNFFFASPAFDVTFEWQLCMHEIEDFWEFRRLLWLLGTFEYYVIYLLQQCFFRRALFSCTFPWWLCGALTRIDSTLRNRFCCFQKLSVHFLISNISSPNQMRKNQSENESTKYAFFLLMLKWKKIPLPGYCCTLILTHDYQSSLSSK